LQKDSSRTNILYDSNETYSREEMQNNFMYVVCNSSKKRMFQRVFKIVDSNNKVIIVNNLYSHKWLLNTKIIIEDIILLVLIEWLLVFCNKIDKGKVIVLIDNNYAVRIITQLRKK